MQDAGRICMFDKKEKEDFDKLIQTGKKHGGRLSSTFLSNYFVGFPSEKQTEDIYNKMTANSPSPTTTLNCR